MSAHVLVNPLAQIIHQHTPPPPPQLGIRGVDARNRPALLVDKEPAQYFRARHNQHASSTVVVVATAIPEPTKSSDNFGSVHPSIHMSLRALFSPRISFFVVFTKDVCVPFGSSLL